MRQPVHIAHLAGVPGLAIDGEVRDRPGAEAHHRHTAGDRLGGGVGEGFLKRRHDDHVGTGIGPGQFRIVGNVAQRLLVLLDRSRGGGFAPDEHDERIEAKLLWVELFQRGHQLSIAFHLGGEAGHIADDLAILGQAEFLTTAVAVIGLEHIRLDRVRDDLDPAVAEIGSLLENAA